MISTAIAALLLGASSPAQASLYPELQNQFEKRVKDYLDHDDRALDTTLVRELRQHGPAALGWLNTCYKKAEYSTDTHEKYMQNQHDFLLFDQVAGQKDAFFSHLFWYTDLEKAKAEAKKQKKTIISLCMLGDFREDLSCANSRFFRIFLYPNAGVNQALRNNFVLHVQSVIDVPKITIEYPDGTKQVQTITGNSMHLALDADGNILDALPGLYGPAYFSKWLTSMNGQTMATVNDYNNTYKTTLDSLQRLTAGMGLLDTGLVRISQSLPRPITQARLASELASVRKVSIERPLFEKIDMAYVPVRYSPIGDKDSAQYKKQLAQRNEFLLVKRIAGLGFMREECYNPGPLFPAPNLIALKRNYTNEELSAIQDQIETQLTVENIRNELLLHSKIAYQMDNSHLRGNMQQFITWAYKELFNTPLTDKKMGMYDPKLFYGITNDGF